MLVPFALYLPFLYYQAKFDFDLGPILALAIGLTTMGMMLVAIGLFFSALTRNQIVAAIWTFVVLFLMIVVVPLVHLRRAAACRLGRGGSGSSPRSTRSGALAGPARPALPGASSFGLRVRALLDGEGPAARIDVRFLISEARLVRSPPGAADGASPSGRGSHVERNQGGRTGVDG